MSYANLVNNLASCILGGTETTEMITAGIIHEVSACYSEIGVLVYQYDFHSLWP